MNPINAKDFGAVGDGVTDDSAAIQAAVDYANKDIEDCRVCGINRSICMETECGGDNG